MAEEFSDRVTAHFPPYGDGPVARDELVRSMTGNLRLKIDSLTTEPENLHFDEPRRTGRIRAEKDIPLTQVQNSFRLSYELFWDAVLREGRELEAVADSDIVVASSRVWAVHQRSMTEMIEEYERTITALRQRGGRDRSILIAMLFSDGEDATLAERELGNQHGFSEQGTYVVAAVESLLPDNDNDDGWEELLRAVGLRSMWIRERTVDFGIIDAGSTRADALPVMRLLTDIFRQRTARAGISAPYEFLRASARARTNAYAALRAIGTEAFPVLVFDGDPLSEIAVAAPDAAKRLAREVLHEVMSLSPQDSRVLLETVEAFYDNDGSHAATADVLFCHPNTIRYRLRRIEELTELHFNNPNHSARLALALKALKYSPRHQRPNWRT